MPFEVNFATDLLPLVDDTAGEVRGFAGPPETFDLGVGTSSTVKSWVVTRGRAPAATTGNSGMCAAWLNDSVPVGVDGVAPDQVFVSPVLPGASTVLLGEHIVSTHRFGAIEVTAGGGLQVVLRGNVEERVSLRTVEVLVSGRLGPCTVRQFDLEHNGETVGNL